MQDLWYAILLDEVTEAYEKKWEKLGADTREIRTRLSRGGFVYTRLPRTRIGRS